jgi:DNA-binding XRE family transcriptional regulator
MTVQKGVKNIRNRLTEEDVMDIYNSEHVSQTALGKRYGVSQSTINHIIKGRTWQWLTKHGE